MTRAANRILAAGVGLAAVMVEQHARRAVHLADDDALGAVDDEGAVHGHERHVAHVDVLLLDIDDRLGLGLGVDLEGGQAQRDAHRRGIGQAALAALVGVVLGMLEHIMVEVEVRGAGEILDREDRAQGLLEARDIADRGVGAEELLIAFALNLDEVRHLADFVDVAENLADSPRGWSRPVVVWRERRSPWSPCVIPALEPGTRKCDAPRPGLRCLSAFPLLLSHSFEPVRGRPVSRQRTGKAPGARHRAAEPLCVGLGRYRRFRPFARGERANAPLLSKRGVCDWRLAKGLEVHRRRQPDLARVAVEAREYPGAAEGGRRQARGRIVDRRQSQRVLAAGSCSPPVMYLLLAKFLPWSPTSKRLPVERHTRFASHKAKPPWSSPGMANSNCWLLLR